MTRTTSHDGEPTAERLADVIQLRPPRTADEEAGRRRHPAGRRLRSGPLGGRRPSAGEDQLMAALERFMASALTAQQLEDAIERDRRLAEAAGSLAGWISEQYAG